MKTIELTTRDRGYIQRAVAAPQQSAQGARGASLGELRDSLRVMDDFKLDDLADTPLEDMANDDAVAYEAEDAVFKTMRKAFDSAKIWSAIPRLTREVLALADKIKDAATKKKEKPEEPREGPHPMPDEED
jgi:hypothetical protein